MTCISSDLLKILKFVVAQKKSMKKIYLTIVVAFFLNSCSDDTIHPNVKELVLENIKENAFVLDEAFTMTAQILQAQGKLDLLVSTSDSPDAFITKMNDMVEDVVLDVIELQGQEAPQFATTVMEWDASASHHTRIQNIVTQDFIVAGGNQFSEYSHEIDDRLDLLQGELLLVKNYTTRKGDEIQVESFHWGVSNQGGWSNGAGSPFSLNYERIKFAKEAIGNMIMTNSELELDVAIQDFVADNPDTEVLMALLLPAVQAPRVNILGEKSSYQELTDLVFGTTITPERRAWDKQVRYAASLVAFDFFTSDDFYNNNEAHASIPVQDAMHYAACVLIWRKIYELYKE